MSTEGHAGTSGLSSSLITYNGIGDGNIPVPLMGAACWIDTLRTYIKSSLDQASLLHLSGKIPILYGSTEKTRL